MALVNRDRVLETSTTTGTGTYTLAGAVTGFQAFSVVGDGNTCHYAAWEVDGSGNPSGGWETGLGTYTASGTTLARTTVIASSNAGAAVNWSAGTRRIACAPLTSGTFIVRQPGGTAGTDEIQISHDGSRAIIRPFDGGTAIYNSGGTLVCEVGRGGTDRIEAANASSGGFFAGNGTDTFALTGGDLKMSSTYPIRWQSASNWYSGSSDTGIVRTAAGVLKVTDGSTGGGWQQQAAARSRVNSNVTNTTITPAAITGLSATLLAGRKYTGRLVLYAAVPTSADGIRIDFDGGTATMTSFVAQGILSDDTSTRKLSRTTALATDITDTDLNGDGLITIELGFVCNAAGTFIPRVAKEADAAGATLTVLANSFLWLEDMP